MALADWTIVGGGTYTIETDGTSPGTNTSVIHTQSSIRLFNITAGDLINARIETYYRMTAFPTTNETTFSLRLRNKGTEQSGTGGTAGDCYRAHVHLIATTGGGADTTHGKVRLFNHDNGSGGALTDELLFPVVTNSLAWQKVRFSCFETGGFTYLRFEVWNGSSYDLVVDVANASPGLQGYAGKAGIECDGGANNVVFLDDTKIYSLA